MKNKDPQSWDYFIKSSVAGGIAGVCAKTVVAPLDRIKILFQTKNPHYSKFSGSFGGIFNAGIDIHKMSGLRGLLQGHTATIFRIYPYAAIKFTANEQFRYRLMPRSEDVTWFKHFIAGSLAGVTSVFFTYPLEIVRVRMAFEISHHVNGEKVSYKSTLRRIFSEKSPFIDKSWGAISGLSNFYRGFVPTMIGMIPYAGISFSTYHTVKTFIETNPTIKHIAIKRKKNGKQYLRPAAELFCGGVAGWTGQTLSYPFEVIRRNMQVGAVKESNGGPSHKKILHTARHIYSRDGIRGFFVGLTIGYIKVIPMSAVSFFVYEVMRRALDIDSTSNNIDDE